MKVKLTTAKAEQLIHNFGTLKEQLPFIKENIQKQMDAKQNIKGVIQPEEADRINAYLEPVLGMLSQYTVGFPSYLRSVGKTEESKKPDAAFLDSVREVLQQAREIKEDFDWMKEHFNQQIKLHNMALGDFRAVSFTEPSEEPEPPQEAAGPTLAATARDTRQSQEPITAGLAEMS